MLTEHRQERVVRALRLAFRPSLDAQPVDLTSIRGLGLADDGDVVLGDARNDARLTADAGVEVDRQAPAIAGVLLRRVHAVARVLLTLAAERLLARGAKIDVT